AANGPSLVESLVGAAIDGTATAADVSFLRHASLTGERAAACLDDLQALPRLATVADKVAIAERGMFLDTLQLMARKGQYEYDILLPKLSEESPPPEWARSLDISGIDWTEALKFGNAWYDRYAEVLRIVDRASMLKALDELDAKVRELGTDVRTPAKLPKSWA